MKAYLKGVLALAACSIMAFASTAQAKEWYEGGTLHKASVAQWHQADEHNRIVTAGDWVHATTSRKYIDLIFDEDPEIMHMAAKMVAQCSYHLNGRYEIQQRQRLDLCSAVHGHVERAT